MKIVVVGAGAMGCLYAGMLSKNGQEVWLLEIDQKRVEKIKVSGLLIDDIHGRQHIKFNTITSVPEEIGTAEVVLIFVKAYDTGEAIKTAFPVISDKTIVMTLQNGFGNIDKIVECVPEERVIAGTTAQGATLLENGHIRHSGEGMTVIGALKSSESEKAVFIKDFFQRAGIKTLISENINLILWTKLLVNSAINPITAIMKIKNGQILEYPNLSSIMHSSVLEVVTVSKRLGINMSYNKMIKKVKDICADTSENVSSMLQDIIACRKTEIEHINGAVVAMGKKANVSTPVNSMLTWLVKSIEEITCVSPKGLIKN